MFLGYYSSILTQKSQLTFPSKFTKEAGKKLFITTWFENSLIILPYESGKAVLTRLLRNLSPLITEERDLERFFYGNAQEVELDEKNRFVLPNRLKEFAHIKKKAVFLGVSERIEIWDEEVYASYSELRERQIREIALEHYKKYTS